MRFEIVIQIFSYNSRASKEKKNFYDANATCNVMNGKLAEIKDKIINKELRKELYKLLGENDYWLGITDSASEGSWRYVSNYKVVSFTNWWYGGRPNPVQPDGGYVNNCAIMNGGSSPDKGYWFDVRCNGNYLFICEFTNTDKSDGN